MRDLNAYIEGNKLRMQEQDAFDYRQGQYFLSALQTALDHAFNGKKAKAQYVEEPFLSNIETVNKKLKDRPLSEEEKKKQIEMFVMKRKVSKMNYDLSRQQ